MHPWFLLQPPAIQQELSQFKARLLPPPAIGGSPPAAPDLSDLTGPAHCTDPSDGSPVYRRVIGQDRGVDYALYLKRRPVGSGGGGLGHKGAAAGGVAAGQSKWLWSMDYTACDSWLACDNFTAVSLLFRWSTRACWGSHVWREQSGCRWFNSKHVCNPSYLLNHPRPYPPNHTTSSCTHTRSTPPLGSGCCTWNSQPPG